MGWNVCKIGKVSQIFLQTWIYRLVPFLSKFFFNAISVGRIDPIKGISWTPQIIPPILPTQSSFFPITKSMNITVIGNITIPQTYQTLPQYLWANSHSLLICAYNPNYNDSYVIKNSTSIFNFISYHNSVCLLLPWDYSKRSSNVYQKTFTY